MLALLETIGNSACAALGRCRQNLVASFNGFLVFFFLSSVLVTFLSVGEGRKDCTLKKNSVKCANHFLFMLIGGRAECLACPGPVARMTIAMSESFISSHYTQYMSAKD